MTVDNGHFCPLVGKCGGCPWGEMPLHQQRQQKLATVKSLFSGISPEVLDLPSVGLRDRVDLIWEDGRLGLYGRSSSGERTLVDVPTCPALSPALENFLKAVRERRPPVRKGSVRLRVSPSGARGIWLDFANQDVKNLFEEREYLNWLGELAFVEIGQRRKSLKWVDGAPKLRDPELRPWFESYDSHFRPIPLYGPVGGFSQAGFVANRALVTAVCRAAEASGVGRWVDLFSGNGNFAVALASRGWPVEAVERERLAIAGLEITLRQRADLKVVPRILDLESKGARVIWESDQGLLVDPPRTGLGAVLDFLSAADSGGRPRALIYVSCFTESFLADVGRLNHLGFELVSLTGVDQFPHSPHMEWISLMINRNS